VTALASKFDTTSAGDGLEIAMKPLDIGWHEGVDDSIYHAQPFCSNSRLNVLHAQSPKHVQHEILNPSDSTPAQVIGSALHTAVLQPHLFEEKFICGEMCGAETKAGGKCRNAGKVLVNGRWLCGIHLKADRFNEIRDAIVDSYILNEFRVEKKSDTGSVYMIGPGNRRIRISDHAPGPFGLARVVRSGMESVRIDLPPYGSDDARQVLTPKDFETVINMRDAIMADPHASDLLAQSSDREVTAIFRLSNGLMCKARLDAFGMGRVCDLKKTRDASENFERSLVTYGYARQGTFYRLAGRAHDRDVQKFSFIAVEDEAPFAVGIHTLTEKAMDLAAEELMPLLDRYHACESSGIWPGYAPRECNLPDWAERKIIKQVEANYLAEQSA
jgi:hypothetical protein